MNIYNIPPINQIFVRKDESETEERDALLVLCNGKIVPILYRKPRDGEVESRTTFITHQKGTIVLSDADYDRIAENLPEGSCLTLDHLAQMFEKATAINPEDLKQQSESASKVASETFHTLMTRLARVYN